MITATKENPVFLVQTDNGYFPNNTIDCKLAINIETDTGFRVISTIVDAHTTDYQTAVSMAIDFCKELKDEYHDRYNYKVNVFMYDGSFNEEIGEFNKTKCYTLSRIQAKKYNLI